LLPKTNCRTGSSNPKVSAHGTAIKLPERALLVRTQGLMPLPQFLGKRLHRDVMAFKTTTHGQPLQGNISEANLFKGGLKRIHPPWGRVYFQRIRPQFVKKGSQIIQAHSPIQGLD
jgi:hypothetical protein